MTVQEHLRLSGLVAVAALPWLKEDVWIPFASSVLIDVDHYIWHALTRRQVSIKAATQYFGQADPPQGAQSRLLHHPLALGGVAIATAASRSRTLRLITVGLFFHIALDLVHNKKMEHLKAKLGEQASGICQKCRIRYGELQLHTLHVAGNPLTRYNSSNFIVVCQSCHKRAHGEV